MQLSAASKPPQAYGWYWVTKQRPISGMLTTEECYYGPACAEWPDGWTSKWKVVGYDPKPLSVPAEETA